MREMRRDPLQARSGKKRRGMSKVRPSHANWRAPPARTVSRPRCDGVVCRSGAGRSPQVQGQAQISRSFDGRSAQHRRERRVDRHAGQYPRGRRGDAGLRVRFSRWLDGVCGGRKVHPGCNCCARGGPAPDLFLGVGRCQDAGSVDLANANGQNLSGDRASQGAGHALYLGVDRPHLWGCFRVSGAAG